MLKTVKVPEQFEPLFAKAQEYVEEYFSKKKSDPAKGTLEVYDERYIMVRAASMSVEFFETMQNLYKDVGVEESVNVARQILFDIAHAIGKQDAKNFQQKMKVTDPIAKLSAGPIHFAYSGWAFVDIFPESTPTPDENYYLIYDHPYSFESDSWIKKGKKSNFPVCIMNAGYSSGWCEDSFGISLVASEITCRAKGDENCRFIMAPPDKIESRINSYLKTNSKLAKKVTSFKIPEFFERKNVEAVLYKERIEQELMLDSIPAMVFYKDKENRFIRVNKAFADVMKSTKENLAGKSLLDVYPKEQAESFWADDKVVISSGKPKMGIVEPMDIEGKTVWVKTDKIPYKDKSGKIIGVVGFAMDVTETKIAEEQVQEKMDTIKRMNELMVGRELKMVELKEEIERLKKDK